MAENKRYYWLRFQEDFFSSLRVKKLKKLGSDYLIIYLEMQLLSIRTGGYLEYKGIEETFAQEIALELDEDPDKVQLTLSYLQSCGLLECTDENEFFLPYVEANIGSETASTQRSRECRAKKMLQCNTSATQVQLDCHVEKEKEIEKDIEKDSVLIDSLHSSIEHSSDESSDKLVEELKEESLDIKVQEIVNEFNRVCTNLPKVQKLTKKRKEKVKARLKTFDIGDIYKAFDKANSSRFLTGKETSWKASFDWFFENDNNLLKVLEGNYDNSVNKPKSSFNNFDQRDYDMKALEKKLINNSG